MMATAASAQSITKRLYGRTTDPRTKGRLADLPKSNRSASTAVPRDSAILQTTRELKDRHRVVCPPNRRRGTTTVSLQRDAADRRVEDFDRMVDRPRAAEACR